MDRTSYLDTADGFAELVARLPADLSGPGLGDWDLRALVGHTSRALITVSTYLRQPADSVALESAADYLAGVSGVAGGAEVTARGVAAGAALGDDPAAQVRSLVAAVTDDLAGADPDQLVTTIGGGMRLRDYLPTRAFELVVHGLDIAHAAGTSWEPPSAAVRESVLLGAEVALRRGDGGRLLRLLTGRGGGGLSIV